MATTVKQLMEYLQTLPPETTVEVLEVFDGGYGGDYAEWVDLELGTNRTMEFVDFTGNKFVKPTSENWNRKYLMLGEK